MKNKAIILTDEGFDILHYISLPHLILSICLLIFGIFCLVLCIKIIKRRKKRLKDVLRKQDYIRQYRINLTEEKVDYFDSGNTGELHHSSLNEFFRFFDSVDQAGIKSWILSFRKKNSASPHYFQGFVYNRTLKNHVLILYRVVKINYEDHLLHLESYLFQNIVKEKITKGSRRDFFDEETLGLNFDKQKKKNVAIYVIHLFSTHDFLTKNSISFTYLTLMRMLNVYMEVIKKSHYVCVLRSNNLCIIDFKPKSNDKVEAFTQELMTRTRQCLAVSSVERLNDYRIGVYYQNNTTLSLKEMIRNAQEIAIYAKNSSVGTDKAIYYNKNINLNNSYHSQLIDEMNRIIRGNAVDTLYSPYIESKGGRVRGYICSYKVKSQLFTDYLSVGEQAYRQGKALELTELIIENSLHGLEDPSFKKRYARNLLIPIQLPFLPYFLKYLKTHTVKDINLSFLINETDFALWKNNDVSVPDLINELNALSCKVALNLNGTSLYVNEDLLPLFSFFVLSPELVFKVRSETRWKILVGDLIARLKKKKISFIASGVETWSGVELLVSLGVDFLSGNIIALATESLQDVSKKISKKISTITD